MDSALYQTYIDILREELVPAMGCTEPIAVAMAGALARKTLGAEPDRVNLLTSGNIIKNVKSVIVPHTEGRKGLRTAVAVGIVCGDADKELEVVSGVTHQDLLRMDAWLDRAQLELGTSPSPCPFDIQVRVWHGEDTAYVRVVGHHTNVVILEKNGRRIIDLPFTEEAAEAPANREQLSIKGIVRFADVLKPEDVRDILQRQIDLNMAIAKEGIRNHWGAWVGQILLRSYGNSVHNRAKAWAAAGSDARMNGCELPVIINSGSGNQGITASVPVIIYARECNVSEELLLRALAVSNLVTIHLKTGIGSLSAYCGATSAGAGAGAGICYLYGGDAEDVSRTVVNALAINSGMICDGAKASCAAKIASSVEAGLLGWQMNSHDSRFYGGDGIVVTGVEGTIDAVSRLAREGMRDTDRQILSLMMEEEDED